MGSGLDSLSSPETSGSSDGPVTQHKKIRCYKENVKVGDDRNYEIEQIRKNEDIIESVERTARSADCIVHTEVTRGNTAADINTKPEDSMNGVHDVPSDITRLDNYKPVEGFKSPDIPFPVHGKSADAGGGYDIPKNIPNLLNDYGGPSKQEYGQESEKSYGSSTSMRRQESYDHQEYSHEKTRTLPGWRSGWGSGEASDDSRWKIKYDTSANEINEVSNGGHVTGNLLATFLLEMLLVLVIH